MQSWIHVIEADRIEFFTAGPRLTRTLDPNTRQTAKSA